MSWWRQFFSEEKPRSGLGDAAPPQGESQHAEPLAPKALSVDQLIDQIRDEYIQRSKNVDEYQAEINRTGGWTPIGGPDGIRRRGEEIEAAGQGRKATTSLIALGASAAEQIARSVLAFARTKDWHVQSVQGYSLDWKVRMGVGWEIGAVLVAIGDERATPVLVDGLTDVDKDVRYMAAVVLKASKDRRAVEPLTRALADDSKDVSIAAEEALKAIGGPDAEAALALHAEKRG